jgi:sigma-B regulation protein RsbU (phosphoserine phosphatase)
LENLPDRHLATLYEITRKLNSSLDLKEVLDYVMDRVIEVTGAERGFLMLRHEDTGILDFRVARGINKQDLDKPKFQVSRTIVNQVAETGESILTDNAQSAYSDTQSVVMMALRSILCVPIKVKDRLIGVVYVDNRLHEATFDEGHLELVAAFASQAGVAIENARLYEIAVEKGRLQRELEMAHDIQQELLPSAFPVLPGYELATYWDSAREVAGDFYDCFLVEDGQRMGVVIADVSGKGAPAALFMAVARSLIRGSAMAADSPEAMLRQVNHLITADAGSSGMFVTVYYSLFKAGGHMLGVNAGHNQPLLWHAKDGSLEWLPKGGRALGWFEDLPIDAYQCQLEPGDMVIFYTDGLTEAEQVNHTAYGEDRLAEIVHQYASQTTAQGMIDAIIKSVQEFVGEAPPFDDRTIVVVRYTGAA